MMAKRFVTIAICLQFACVVIDLFYIDAVFRWIANSKWLWKDQYPWVPDVLGIAMIAATIGGSILFFVCLAWGTARQRIVCIIPGLVLLWFLWFIIQDVMR
jgi:hypothetical protein